jgi:hypothetical protein
MNKIKDTIVDFVENHNHCTAVEVAVEIASTFPVHDYDAYDLIIDLIKEGRICGIEYVVPRFESKTKLLLFPKGTKAKLFDGDSVIKGEF